MKYYCASHYQRLDESLEQVTSILKGDKDLSSEKEDSMRSRVAMDFTGKVGRIIEDPKESRVIALAERSSWKKRLQFNFGKTVLHRTTISNTQRLILKSGIYTTEPWFHVGICREQANVLVQQHSTFDGVFLIRSSRSTPGAFVITYNFGGNVFHARITRILDPVRNMHIFSIDAGVTKFYDLLQLVEFYQLNSGCLPTKLRYYTSKS